MYVWYDCESAHEQNNGTFIAFVCWKYLKFYSWIMWNNDTHNEQFVWTKWCYFH